MTVTGRSVLIRNRDPAINQFSPKFNDPWLMDFTLHVHSYFIFALFQVIDLLYSYLLYLRFN
jgi:hypothetical protein